VMTEGMRLVRAGRLEDALAKFQEVSSIFPQDMPMLLIIGSLKNVLEQN
jgi:hypothetical protein